MPPRRTRTCPTLGCLGLVVDGRCQSCGRTRVLSRRPTPRDRLYDHRWQKASAGYLKANPLCVACLDMDCTEPAVVVDHTIPHRGDLELFWDEANWQSLCKRHHDQKTARGQ